MRVAMEPPKPERVRCAHCSTDGCGIYDDRPEVCRGFQCLWLASQRIPGHALPPAMRPDRSGVVLDLNEAMTVIAHTERPNSWRREPMRSWLLSKAARHNVILERDGGAALLAADERLTPLTRVGVDPDTNNRLYVRTAHLAKYHAQEAAA
jgi:hypothetical protein